VLERLTSLDDKERMILLNKYTRQTEDIYCTFSAKDNINIINKILLLKHSKDALVEFYTNGDPVVDYPGCRLNEFLNSEYVKY
jgi:MinD superfamily P-loop ATPase